MINDLITTLLMCSALMTPAQGLDEQMFGVSSTVQPWRWDYSKDLVRLVTDFSDSVQVLISDDTATTTNSILEVQGGATLDNATTTGSQYAGELRSGTPLHSSFGGLGVDFSGAASGLMTWVNSLAQPVITSSFTSLGSAITGQLAIADGGTNATSQTTNGVNYFDGTSITSGTGLVFNGTNVGIGTTTPGNLLTLGGSFARVEVEATGSHAELWLDRQTTNSTAVIEFRTDSVTQFEVGLDNNTADEGWHIGNNAQGSKYLTVATTGQIGVSTSTPWAGFELAVAGDVITTGNLFAGGSVGSSAAKLNVYNNDAGVGGGVTGVTVEQDGDGDAVMQFLITGTRWITTCVDNSNADSYVISHSSSCGTSNMLELTTAGVINPVNDIQFNRTSGGTNNGNVRVDYSDSFGGLVWSTGANADFSILVNASSAGVAGVMDIAESNSTFLFRDSSGDTIWQYGENSMIFNENSADIDYRWETNGNANALVIDGGGDFLSSSACPSTTVEIPGGCIDTNEVASGSYNTAVAACVTAGGYVPLMQQYYAGFVAGMTNPDDDDEWVDVPGAGFGTVGINFDTSASATVEPDDVVAATLTDSHVYRCAYNAVR